MERLLERPLTQKNDSIEALVKRSQDIVFEAQAIFPLDVLPDRLIIDRSKIVIIFREFLGIATEHTILLHEVRDVDVELNYFTGTLRILVSGPGVLWTSIANLHKSDAMRAKQIIDGLLIAKSEAYNLDQLAHDEMVKQLTALGSWDQKSHPR